jgi:hypothetical protein
MRLDSQARTGPGHTKAANQQGGQSNKHQKYFGTVDKDIKARRCIQQIAQAHETVGSGSFQGGGGRFAGVLVIQQQAQPVSDHRAGLVKAGGCQRFHRHQDARTKGDKADRPVRFIGQNAGNCDLMAANPCCIADLQPHGAGQGRIDQDGAGGQWQAGTAFSLWCANNLWCANKGPAVINSLERNQFAFIPILQHRPHFARTGQRAILAGKADHLGRRFGIEGTHLDIAAKQQAGIAGNTIAHRLGNRPDGADGGNAQHQRAKKHPETRQRSPNFAASQTPGKAPAGIAGRQGRAVMCVGL